jgi:hypothetical protein
MDGISWLLSKLPRSGLDLRLPAVSNGTRSATEMESLYSRYFAAADNSPSYGKIGTGSKKLHLQSSFPLHSISLSSLFSQLPHAHAGLCTDVLLRRPRHERQGASPSA